MLNLAEEASEDGWTCANRMNKWRLVKRRGSDHKGKPEPKPNKRRGGKAKKAEKAKART